MELETKKDSSEINDDNFFNLKVKSEDNPKSNKYNLYFCFRVN